eukprot:3114255-Rhodomonas_salina.1
MSLSCRYREAVKKEIKVLLELDGMYGTLKMLRTFEHVAGLPLEIVWYSAFFSKDMGGTAGTKATSACLWSCSGSPSQIESGTPGDCRWM